MAKKYDVCVVGGGTSGAFCAIASAKLGLKTIVIEKFSSLGGTSTNGLVMPSMPTYVGKTKLLGELEETLSKYDGELYSKSYLKELNEATTDRPDESSTVMYFSKEGMEFSLEDLCVKYGVDIIYDATFVSSEVNEGQIKSITVQTNSGNLEVKARNFVDATGDAILSSSSGVEVKSGNEFSKNQFTSLRFEISNINMDTFLTYITEELGQTYSKSEYPHFTFGVLHQGKEQVLEPLMKKAVDDGVLSSDEYRWLQGFSIPSKGGTFTFNSPRIPYQDDVIDYANKTANYIKGREMIKNFHKFLKLYVKGFEECNIGNIAPMLGIRESRRIVGKYTLTADNYKNRSKFDDGVVRCDWWIDIHKNDHNPEDEVRFNFKEYFEIPYRSLITDKIKNLVVIGRCISADFAAQASIRIQPQCRMMGEAAAYACLFSKETNLELNQIDGKSIKGEMKYYEEI